MTRPATGVGRAQNQSVSDQNVGDRDVYDHQVARHYAAYRPPLHRMILEQALGDLRFQAGADIGCGTGRSSVALADRCDQVVAADISQAMLDGAEPHPRVDYKWIDDDRWPIDAGSIDVATFAGALFYLDRKATLAELRRCARADALIVPYDFRIRLGPLCDALGIARDGRAGAYDHACSLEDAPGVETLRRDARAMEVPASHEETAHVLLASASRLGALRQVSDRPDPHAWVAARLDALDWPKSMVAETFFAVHRLAGRARTDDAVPGAAAP